MKSILLCLTFGVIAASAGFMPQGGSWGQDWGSGGDFRHHGGDFGPHGGNFDHHGGDFGHHGGQKPGPKPAAPACKPADCKTSKDKCGLTAEQNKKIVLDFYNQVFVRSNFSAVDIYYAPNIIQHNPFIGDGKKPFYDFISTATPVPAQVFRPVAECDIVYLHVKTEDNETRKPNAVVDIFRLECGKIVEHWDVTQEIPAKSDNPRPMF